MAKAEFCERCNKLIVEPLVNYAINPDEVCKCPPALDRAYEDRERETQPLRELAEECAAIIRRAVETNGGVWPSGLAVSCIKAVIQQDRERAIQEAVAGAYQAAIQALWERVGHEEYGHAKAAVTLDIEAVSALVPADAQAALDSRIERAIEAGIKHGREVAKENYFIGAPMACPRPTPASIREQWQPVADNREHGERGYRAK